MSGPSKRMLPWRAGVRPSTERMVVVFPAPLPPSNATTSPAPTSSEAPNRSEEHTSELQSLMRISYAVFCLKKKNTKLTQLTDTHSYYITNTTTQHHTTTYHYFTIIP